MKIKNRKFTQENNCEECEFHTQSIKINKFNWLKFSLLLMISLFLSATIKAQCVENMPKWILGTWVIDNQSNISFENWQNSGDTLYFGKTYALYQNDTVLFDEMFIKCIDDKPMYFMMGTKENTKVFAAYKLHENSDANTLIFKNSELDFPNEFSYTRVDDNLIFVWFKNILSSEACVDFKMIKTFD